MRVIARRTLLDFAAARAAHKDHAALVSALDAWFAIARRADWANSADVRQTFSRASIINAERVVFDIKGNDYRLVAALDYRYAAIYTSG